MLMVCGLPPPLPNVAVFPGVCFSLGAGLFLPWGRKRVVLAEPGRRRWWLHSVKQNGEVLSDLQFFNEGSGLSLDLGRGCLQLWAVADLACSALEPSPLVGK